MADKNVTVEAITMEQRIKQLEAQNAALQAENVALKTMKLSIKVADNGTGAISARLDNQKFPISLHGPQWTPFMNSIRTSLVEFMSVPANAERYRRANCAFEHACKVMGVTSPIEDNKENGPVDKGGNGKRQKWVEAWQIGFEASEPSNVVPTSTRYQTPAQLLASWKQ